LWSCIDQTQHALNLAYGPYRSRNFKVQRGGWYLLHVLHASPHTAEHREKREVSKKFNFRVCANGTMLTGTIQKVPCATSRSLVPEEVLKARE
jgi:hypothetical protein